MLQQTRTCRLSHTLAVVNSVVANTDVQAVTHLGYYEQCGSEHGCAGVSMNLDSFGTPKSSLAELYESSIFECLRNLYTNFHRCWANFHPHQQGVMLWDNGLYSVNCILIKC